MNAESPVKIVRRFAEALDHEDYALARELLAEECVYRIRGEEHAGPEAIISSYQGNGDEAARSFDSIAYRSAVRPEGAGSATIEFVDEIQHRGLSLTHRCEQRVAINDVGKIVRIDHADLPGERSRLESFRKSCGPGGGPPAGPGSLPE